MRQATRELVKAYIHGIDSQALDDVFELMEKFGESNPDVKV